MIGEIQVQWVISMTGFPPPGACCPLLGGGMFLRRDLGFGQYSRQTLPHALNQRLGTGDVAGDAIDIIIGTHQRGLHAMSGKPICDHAIAFAIRLALCADRDQLGAQCTCLFQQFGIDLDLPSIQDDAPATATHGIHQQLFAIDHQRRLREQATDGRMRLRRQQSGFQGRNDVLARYRLDGPAIGGDQACIACPGGVHIAFADQFSDLLDAACQRTHMCSAFLAIRIQQAGIGSVGHDQLQLPDQIGDIANALAHALAQERRLLVGSIAGDEDAAAVPLLGHQRVEAIAGLAPERGIFRRDPALEHAPGAFFRGHIFRIIAFQQRDLPTAMIARADHIAAWALRLAELNTGLGQLGQAAFIDQNIHDQPRLVEVQVFQFNPGGCAHIAGGAVAADQVLGADGVGSAQFVAHFYSHTGVILRKAGEFHAGGHVDLIDGGHALAQDALHRRLGEHHGRCVAQRERRLDHGQALDQVTIDAVVLRWREGFGMFGHRLCYAKLLEYAHDLVIQRDGTRLLVDVVHLVDDQHIEPGLAEQCRRDRTGRPEADHDDVIVRLHATSPSAPMVLTSRPMRSISISTLSPCFIHTGGVRDWPTPAGVPMMMTSPGSRVTHSVSSAMVSATFQIMSRVLASCITSPLRRHWMDSPSAPGGSSSAETRKGPKAPVLSKFLPMVHCGVFFWQSRTDMSLKAAQPKTQDSASSWRTWRPVVLPITTATSASQSKRSETLGAQAFSWCASSELVARRKNQGQTGFSRPLSAA
eukprot:TRINITY_DN1458_c0_g1_i1.p2 TRINITY_DN1458_c0_g1~~TRINITY_DN1458_c0_g1_i1.p2  ORF type:complete len:758 (+),score=206.27 TRINITY_DN1458_c0_g1_i1:4238-6511(+)